MKLTDYQIDLLKAAFIRALRTAAQTAIAVIGSSTVLEEVDWTMVASATALAAIVSLLMSVAGLPEVDDRYVDIDAALAALDDMGDDEDIAEDHEEETHE